MKKIIFTLASVLAIAPLSIGCDDGLIHVHVAEVTHSLFYAPQYVADTLGYFEDEGLKVSFTNAQGANLTMAMLLSNDAQIGLMGSEATVYVYNGDEPNYAINFAQLTQKDGSFLLGREQEENFDFTSLKGKEIIGGRDGGMPEMVLEYILKSKGLEVGRDDPSKEVYVRTDIEFAAMGGRFLAGEGDYVSLFEPLASDIEASGNGYIVASLGKESGSIPYTTYSTTRSYLENNGEIVEKFTRAIYRGLEYVKTHTAFEIATAISSHFIDTPLDRLSISLQNYIDIEAWTTNLRLEEEGFDKMQDILEMAGKLDKRVDYQTLVDNTIVNKILAEN